MNNNGALLLTYFVVSICYINLNLINSQECQIQYHDIDTTLLLSYNEAHDYCMDHYGSHLATLSNECGEQEIKTKCNDNNCFIGIYDEYDTTNNKDIFYYDIRDYKYGKYTMFWFPNSNQGTKLCAQYNINTNLFELETCSIKQYFMCNIADPIVSCEDNNLITHINWGNLMESGKTDNLIPYSSYELNIDQSTLDLSIEIDLEYLGYSIGDRSSIIGTTYILNFDIFRGDGDKNGINHPGSCENRNGNDFVNKSWEEYWKYSDTPYLNQHIGSNKYLAYPPNTDFWSISNEYDPSTDIEAACTRIHYSARFPWTTLANECLDSEGINNLIELTTSNEWINVSGTFYVSIVSPLSPLSNTGYYRIYQLISHPFVISISKSSSIIASTGINLFTMSLIAVYKEKNDQKPNEDDFKLIVLTESADYIYLSLPTLLATPVVAEADFKIVNEPYSGQDCLVSTSSAICTQLWEIHALNVDCPPNSFTGTYGIKWIASCEKDECLDNEKDCKGVCFGSWETDNCDNCLLVSSEYWNDCTYEPTDTSLPDSCEEYIGTYGSEVLLSSDLTWSDDICDDQVWVIEFEGLMNFYRDIEFNNLQEDYLYKVGEDRVYVEVLINYPSSTYSVFQSSLTNVWICSIDPDIRRSKGDELVFISQDLKYLGCLNENVIDNDGPYWIIQNYNEQTNNGAVHHAIPDGSTNKVRFSFIIPDTIIRDTMYIHTQITLSLVSDDDQRRRSRVLLDIDIAVEAAKVGPNILSNPNPSQFLKNVRDVDNMDQIRHFSGITKIINKKHIFGDKRLHNEWNKNMLILSTIVFVIFMFAGVKIYKIHKSDPINWNRISELIHYRQLRRLQNIRIRGNDDTGRIYYGHILSQSDTISDTNEIDDDLMFSHDDGCADYM